MDDSDVIAALFQAFGTRDVDTALALSDERIDLTKARRVEPKVALPHASGFSPEAALLRRGFGEPAAGESR